MIIASPQLTTRPPTSPTQRLGGTNKIQRFQRTQKTPKTPGKGTGRGFGSSTLRRSPGLSSGAGFGASNLRSAAPASAVTPPSSPVGKPASSPSSAASQPNSKPKGGGKVPGLGSLGVGINARGDIDLGVSSAGIGATVSTRGDLSLGVGVASVTWNFRNPNESALGFGFNTLTITGEQQGCQIILSYRILGKIVNQETRMADECSSPDPEPKRPRDPKPTPEPSPDPSPNSDPTTPPKRIYFKAGYYAIMVTYPSEIDRTVDLQELYSVLKNYYRLSTSNIEAIKLYLNYYSFIGSYFFPRDGYLETFYNVSPPLRLIRFPIFDGFNREAAAGFSVKDLDGNQMQAASPVEGLVFPFRSYSQQEVSESTNPPFKRRNLEDPTWGLVSLNPVVAKPKHEVKPRGLEEEMDKQQLMIDRIYDMLGGDDFYEEGLAVPNEMFTPEADGNSTQTKTYNGAVNLLFRTIDHRTPAQVKFPLANGAEYTSINAEGYFADLGKNVSELLEKTNNTGKADNSEVMGYMHRVSLINTQIFNLLIKINELVKGIVGFLGIPMRETVEVVDIPFDPTMKGKLAKGFGSPNDLDKELEKLLKDQNATEEGIKETVARYASSGKIPVRVKKLRQSNEGGDFWWLIRNALNLKK